MTNAATAAVDAVAGIEVRIAVAAKGVGRDPSDVRLIAVSKTFDAPHIRPVLEAGHRDFGENRVQEAQGKWPALKAQFPGVRLHLIGPLQSNKAKEAVQLFDAIHSVDREKIARALAAEMNKQGRTPELYVQVNTGEEPQKAGIMPRETAAFVALCRDELKLDIAGLMCIPPVDDEPAVHFAFLLKLARELGLVRLSMGMSSDFETAVELGATDIRVGSAIFGVR
ncbi:MAG: YggS family pyridoxal phosphate-dependent enzyme [Hyphomicrobium sp.]|nr:YggS family pyridoxal phosphate-dependent enzyme [Hyphomicrobium sp.]PPC82099.1 MAG: YggS family pyridoxal phosphate-dependent enzyme [Hyphomicrobium sp.]